MLAERVVEWTREWKAEGIKEGRKEGVEESAETLRLVLLSQLEQRFGFLPAQTRLRVEAIGSIKELGELIARSVTAPSLESLGLS